MSVAVTKTWELFFVGPEVKSQWTVLVEYLLSQKMLAVIKQVADDNIIYLSATQLMHAPEHGSSNAVQQLLRKTFNLMSYGPNRPELRIIY